MKEFKQGKIINFKRIKEIVLSAFILLAVGITGYLLSLVLFVEAQVQIPLPFPTSPPLSCTGCHSFQAGLFTNVAYHHPNAIAFQGPTDMVTKVKAIRQDCCACHNYLLNHAGGMVMLKDPDPTDAFPYNGDPVLTNNLCLSCHDQPDGPIWFSVNGRVTPGDVIAPMWCFPCAHAVNSRRNLRCLDCHKYHGSVFKSMLWLDQPQLCYMNGCHPEKAVEFNINNPSHHHVEGVLLGGVPTDVIACGDCHNPHHDTIKYPICDPYSKADFYPAVPLSQVTEPIIGINNYLISGPPFFLGNTNAAGVPTADLFCLECHAPDIFIPPNPPWPGAPNISFEINSKYYDPAFTVSNFFYPHRHTIAASCSQCHTNKSGTIPRNTLNGHYTHLKNASCTYCHDPHGTLGTFVGGTTVGVIGTQRGHLLKDWLLADSTTVNPLPYGGGYWGRGIYSTTAIKGVDGASSCFINDPLGGCHDITRIHNPLKIKPTSVCNLYPCHLTFTPLLLRAGAKPDGGADTLAPAPPK